MTISSVSISRKDSLRSLRRKLYAFSFFDEFILIYPLYALMFQAHGLSGAQISSLLIVLSAVIFVLQVPAGSMADVLPRRRVLIAAVLARALAFACWLAWPDYAGFLAGFVLWGVKRAFVSGTIEAFVYDELSRLGHLETYTKLSGRMQTYALGGFIFGGLGAGALASYGYSVILIASITAVCLSAFAIFTLPSAPATERLERASYVRTLRAGVRTVAQHPKLLFLISFGTVVGGLKVVDEYYGLFLHGLRFDNRAVALLTTCIYVFGALGSSAAHRLERKNWPAGYALMAWAGSLCLTTILPRMLAPFAIGLFAAQYYAMSVIINARVQHVASDSVRATTLSLMNFAAEFLSLAVYATFIATSGHGYAPGLRTVSAAIAGFGVVTCLLSYVHATRRQT